MVLKQILQIIAKLSPSQSNFNSVDMTFTERQALMEDDFQWKTTSDRRQHALELEDDLQWRKATIGRRIPMINNLQ